ncbi:MAG: SoxR reducing system RseC family protein [Gammaproteobacteria bacterium]|nr:SoxR reducing system RseC family protein [Gammaproteobacteria bacterium]
MIEEQARICELAGDDVWVEVERRSACGSCEVRGGCGTSVLATVLGRRMSRIKVQNSVSASLGDSVVVGIPDAALIQGSLAVYAAPLLSMLLFALLGEQLIDDSQWVEIGSIIGGLLGLSLGFFWLRYYTRRIAKTPHHQPVILRKVWPLQVSAD